ncbi:MAG: DEAD/DEAH box helicase [Chloroflexota bacterium]
MYALHLHWRPPATPTQIAEIILWAENGTGQRPRKRKVTVKAKPHPYSEMPDVVFDLLETVGLGDTKLRPKETVLQLPTGAYGPRPSPILQHSWSLSNDDFRPVLSPWKIKGLSLTPEEGFDLLTHLPSSDDLPVGLSVGADLHYWRSVSDLVLELLAQQKILPTLARADVAGKSYHARWLPILDGPNDASRLEQLQQAMPPLCRAEIENVAEAPHPRHLLDAFLNVMGDMQMRRWGQLAWQKRPFTETSNLWLNALFTPDPTFTGSALQLIQFNRSYKAWLRTLHLAGDKHSRVAFRLQAPAQQQSSRKKSQSWTLHFALQARNDPSLLVPANQIWQTKGNVLKSLDQRFETPQETFLTGLGYAARLFDPLKPTLKSAKPKTLKLSTQAAFDFLRDAAPLLESSGFGVLVPPWWNKAGTRLGVRLNMSSQSKQDVKNVSSGKMNFENLIQYKWEISLGDTTLTREEFEALAALKSPLVQIRGQWVHLDAEQIEAAINFWDKQDAEAAVTLSDAIQLGLGGKELNGLPIDEVDYEGELKAWMDRFRRDETLTLPPVPTTLQAQLRPYQEYGYAWLNFMRQWGLGACLADDMGLGKTIQTLTMLAKEKEEQGTLSGPVLLICPTSVVANWGIETKRFTPTLTAMQHQGANRLHDDEFVDAAQAHDLVLTSYAVVRRDAEAMQRINWFGVVLDEAQNIKNPSTKQSQTIRSLKADFKLALTGTPVENRLSELWSIMQFLNPGYLGSRKAFRSTFTLPIERHHDEAAATQLRQMTAPFILRRLKTDPTVIQDLPEKNEMKIYCNLSEEQATLYESVVQSSIEAMESMDEGIERKGIVLGMLMKLKQVCNHPAQFLHQIGEGQQLDLAAEMQRSGKLARLSQMLEETLAVGDRSLIFSQFAEMGGMLQTYLQQKLGVPTLFLHGGVPAKKRAEMVQSFQEDANGPPIFLLSLKAGGTGLNLTQANHVFHFDRWWNPAVEDQATDRAFRIGQRKNVQVHKFIAVGTLEEMIDEMIESKKALAERIVGQGEGWLTELSTADLRNLVALRREAFE